MAPNKPPRLPYISALPRPSLQPLARAVLLERYAHAGEHSIEDVQQRVAHALASNESRDQREKWSAYFWVAQNAGLIPAGRINAYAGLAGPATLINCFVQPSVMGRGLSGIGAALEMALATLRAGGGVGYDFSDYPPASGDGREPGPVAAIERFNEACAGLSSGAGRRCAQMAVLRCDHPDIPRFIHAKDHGGLENFNMSVGLTDAFMQAVVADEQIALPQATGAPRVSARALWREVLMCAYDHGEPGVLFLDRINHDNNLKWCEQISATNPCGEQPLPLFGGCDLASINLTRFVRSPFSDAAGFDYRGFVRVIDIAVRLLDNVLDISHWPLPAQRIEAMQKRRVGLGFTGLADALIMLGLHYDSDAARAVAGRIARRLRDRAYLASCKLSAERGPFPLFDADKYLSCEGFASRLPARIKRLIRDHGIRNSHLLAIAPAGTISLAFGNNVSNGIEPVFAARYERKKRMPGGGLEAFAVSDFAALLYQELTGEPSLPPCFVSAQSLSPEAHVAMAAAVSPFIDAGISKTVNLAPGTSFEDFEGVFMLAWQMGLKGLTAFRPHAGLATVLGSPDCAIAH